MEKKLFFPKTTQPKTLSIFLDFLNVLKGVFSFTNIVKHFTLAYMANIKNIKEWPLLDQNHGFTPLKNVNFSLFWTSCFYSLERRFSVLKYLKRHFPSLYFQKKKVGKMAIFRPKPWVNPFGKLSIFRLFKLLVFIAKKAVFSF